MIRILVVDDQNIIRQGIQAILESSSNIEVVGTAENGTRAIEQVEILRPDVILMDIEMPRTNGINATYEICQRFPQTKILVLSSYKNSEYIVQSLKAGAEGYLLKSTLANDLERAILSLCRGQLQIESRLLNEPPNETSLKPLKKSTLARNHSVSKTMIQSGQKTMLQPNGYGDYRFDSDEGQALKVRESPIRDNKSFKPVPKETETQKPSEAIVNAHFVRDLSSKNTPLRLLILLLCLVLLGGGIGYTYRQLKVADRKQRAEKVITVSAEKSDVSINTEANGTIIPEKQINISPKTVSVVKRLLVKEGESVKQGEILAYMDDLNLQGELIEAQGRLEAAEARLRGLLSGNRIEDIVEAEAQLRNNEATLRQAELTFEQNQTVYEAGGISQRDFEASRSALDVARARVAEAEQVLARIQAGARPEEINRARAQVSVAKGRLKTIQTQLQDLVIRAPFDGVVSRKFADPGAFVSPTTAGSSEASATSSSILSLSATNQIVANVSENDISQISLGQQVNFQADAYPEKTFRGRVTQIAVESTVEENVTSFEIKIAILDDSDKILLSGMNVNIKFLVGEQKEVLVVPNTAIVRQPDAVGVFVLDPNSKPVFTPIKTGVTVSDKTVIKSGLTGKEKVLISSPASLESPSIIPNFFKNGFLPKRLK